MILPASLPFQASKSFSSLSVGTAMTCAVTDPLVAGDHGVAWAIKTAVSGVTISTEVLIWRQPMPNSPQLSRRALAHPIAVSWSRVHALALAKLGEPVSRGPISSNSELAYSITCERVRPSPRMRAYIARSRDSLAG